MNHLLAFLCGLAVTALFLHLARRHAPDDLAAGVAIGRASDLPPPSPWPAKHLVSVCMYCHHVTRSDGLCVRVGDVLRVSHGVCPACLAAHHPEHARRAAEDAEFRAPMRGELVPAA